MTDEIKVVHREETFNDLAVRELAKNRAACICRLQFGRCSKKSCKSCTVHSQFMNCFNSLSDYDKLRLNSYTAQEYMSLSANPNNWRTHKSYILHYLGFVAMLLLFMLLLFIPIGLICPSDMPSDRLFDKQIMDVRDATNKIIWDVDKDGKVDCVDHAILFKILWDNKYPQLKDKCEIVRNYNPGTMNHLFIGIKNKSDWIFVEPWARQANYDMELVWGNAFDRGKNRYGETEKWLRTIR